MSNFRMPSEKIHVEYYEAKGNILKAKLYPYCPFKVGEAVDVDNEKARITGQVIDKLGNFVKIRITNIKEKPQIPIL
jgi:hypothetical protein